MCSVMARHAKIALEYCIENNCGFRNFVQMISKMIDLNYETRFDATRDSQHLFLTMRYFRLK